MQASETEWFAMSSERQKKHITCVQSVQSVATKTNTPPMSDVVKSLQQSNSCSESLSVDLKQASLQTNIPVNCLHGLWKKANDLIRCSNSIAPAPRLDKEARMVLSYSGNTPRVVVPNKFSCDVDCPIWKSLGLCSHTVVVTEVNHKLESFLAARRKKKQQPGNLTNLLTTTMPKGRGCKRGSAPRSRKPVTSKVEMNLSHPTPVTKTCDWTTPHAESYE